jgi:hypothetical protein
MNPRHLHLHNQTMMIIMMRIMEIVRISLIFQMMER